MPSPDDREPASELGHAETVTPEAAPEPASTARLGERPEADRLARAVARSRIANKLFATSERVQLGRYHLLELVGSGGMGVVRGAWDPELERRVGVVDDQIYIVMEWVRGQNLRDRGG